MWIESTQYYARPGQAQAVLQMRRRATAVRLMLGLAPGEIRIKVEGVGPDVSWECRFASAKDFAEDMAARAASDEFVKIRKSMHELLEKFDRHVQQIVPDN